MYKILAILAMLSLGTSGCSVNHSDEKLTAIALSKKQPSTLDTFLAPSALWQKARLGTWECAVPDMNPDATLVCSKGNRVVFLASDDSDGLTVSIPLSTKNKLMGLSLNDRDKDGSYESLYYDGTSKSGEPLRIVSDDNLDGNMDRITDLRTKKTSVRIDDVWIDLENIGRDDKGLIIYKANINGSVKRVNFSSYPYQVVDLPVAVNSATQPK